MNQVREIAQRFADVEFSDFGTLGGNVAPDLVEQVRKLTPIERLAFAEYYSGIVKLRLLDPNFEENTAYQTTQVTSTREPNMFFVLELGTSKSYYAGPDNPTVSEIDKATLFRCWLENGVMITASIGGSKTPVPTESHWTARAVSLHLL